MRTEGVVSRPHHMELRIGHDGVTLILRRGGEAAASKGEGCELGAECAADASRLCPSAKAPQHEGEGVVARTH